MPHTQVTPHSLRAGSKIGKYRIQKRLSDGGFARVYRALDTIQGVPVALKIPHPHLVTRETLRRFRAEARLHAALDHPNILPVKNAELIDGHFVIIYPLGLRSLDQRLRNRMTMEKLLDFAEQMLEAVSHAHSKGIVHCDLKPENFILFADNRLRLSDFGISRLAMRTLKMSGSGTVGYMAPEQAMGRTSFRSDVFSLGLIQYQMLTGCLPEWPFAWPLKGYERMRGKLHPDLQAFLRRALEIDPRRRYPDARQMLAAFRRLKPRVRRFMLKQRRRRNGVSRDSTRTDWKQIRFRHFERQYRNVLRLDRHCTKCRGPTSEAMSICARGSGSGSPPN